VGFEPTISVLERAKTVRALDRGATAIDRKSLDLIKNKCMSMEEEEEEKEKEEKEKEEKEKEEKEKEEKEEEEEEKEKKKKKKSLINPTPHLVS
jgi:hypothetical protein